MAACEACRRLTGAEVVIRWPNDLLWSGRKLGGVIAELRSAGNRARELVIGTGLNISHTEDDLPAELSGSATSLRLAAGGRAPRREQIAAAYLQGLARVVGELERGSWACVAQRWESLAPGAVGLAVRVRSRPAGEGGYDGVTAGLDETGALRVRRADGSLASVRQAESLEGPDRAIAEEA